MVTSLISLLSLGKLRNAKILASLSKSKQFHEEVPLEIKMADLGEKHGDKETEDIIKEKKA